MESRSVTRTRGECPGAGSNGSGRPNGLEALEQLIQTGIGAQSLEIPNRQRGPTARSPLTVAEGDDAVTRERLSEMLGRPEHRAAQGMVAEHGLVDQVLGDGRGLVVVAGDLLDDDAALLVQLDRVERRAADEVRQQIGRLDALGRARGDVEGDHVMARVGVEDGAVALGRLVDVAVGLVLLAALEHEVLEEVRHAVLLGPLGAGAGIESDHQRDRARAVHGDPVQRQAVA